MLSVSFLLRRFLLWHPRPSRIWLQPTHLWEMAKPATIFYSSSYHRLFAHLLNVCWLCHLLWPIEYCGSDTVQHLSLGLLRPCSCFSPTGGPSPTTWTSPWSPTTEWETMWKEDPVIPANLVKAIWTSQFSWQLLADTWASLAQTSWALPGPEEPPSWDQSTLLTCRNVNSTNSHLKPLSIEGAWYTAPAFTPLLQPWFAWDFHARHCLKYNLGFPIYKFA